MIVNRFYKPNDTTKPGIRFTSKKILKFAIILLGASLNITTVLTVGKFSLTVMLFTLATCFGLGYFIGKALGLNWKTSSLINAGTGICGGSAIAAIAPVIDATDMDVAYGLSATFLFDMVMVVVFPILAGSSGFPTRPSASGRARRSTTHQALWLPATLSARLRRFCDHGQAHKNPCYHPDRPRLCRHQPAA